MKKKILMATASTIVAVGIANAENSTIATSEIAQTTTQPTEAMLTPDNTERCYGIAKSAQNDCGNALHGCAGEGVEKNSKKEWLMVPKGLCNKIIGGSTNSDK